MEMDTSASSQMDTPLLPDGSSELEAITLAREIQQLVHSLPPATTDDSRLIALLSNASFMNGSSLKTSIWAMLENIHPTSSPNLFPTPSSPTHVGSEIQPVKEDEPTTAASSPNIYPNQLTNDSFSDTSSIMVYSPLFPTQSDIVELAELVPYDTDSGGEVEERDAVVDSGDTVRTQANLAGRPSWTLKWPFSIWYRRNQPQQGISQTLNGGVQQQSVTSSQVGTNNVEPNPPTTQRIRTQRSKRSWVPSPSKISIQAFWWGFRLYLPPPIIEILTDGSMEATRQTEVITKALTWFFNALPIDAFPLHTRHYLMLLQMLIPFIGYIASCISFGFASWIGGLDVGCGITLTATWIVPVALIPGTWYETDFPKSPVPNSPIPLPPNRPFSMQSFELATPAMSTTTTMETDDDIPTSAYATPMSTVISLRPIPEMPDLTLASSSTAWSASPPPQLPPHLPISSPILHSTTDLLNSSSNDSLYFTPDSQTTTPIAHHFFQPLPSTISTSSVPFTLNPFNTTTLPSPRIRTPRFSTRMGGSYSPSINANKSSIPPHLIIHNTPPPPSPITPIPTSTPIPMPPTPIDLPPIPPDLPLSPKLANELLRGPVLQIVPLPDVDDDGVGGVVGVGVGVGVGGDLDKSSSGVGGKVAGSSSSRTRTRVSSNLKHSKKGVNMEKSSINARTF